MTPDRKEQLVTGVGVREYFQDAVQAALINQRLSVCDETVIYIVNLLIVFVRAEQLFESTEDGFRIKPLVMIYAEVVEARSDNERDRSLQKLGDIALFISGLFAHSLSRSLVDVDYYIAMGGSAYTYLADSGRVSRNNRVLKEVYIELGNSFTKFVDVFAEVGEQAQLNDSSDILRLYEIWQCSGSDHAAEKLRKLGIQPLRIQPLTH